VVGALQYSLLRGVLPCCREVAVWHEQEGVDSRLAVMLFTIKKGEFHDQ
jgi:hypothetical protein